MEHYFTDDPSKPSEPLLITLKVRDFETKIHSDVGVFAAREVDKGSIVLCNATIPPTAAGDLLDLGCGYGTIAIVLARRYPDRTVWAVDVNTRALNLTMQNAAALGLTNIQVCLPDQVPEDVRFGSIYSNPPIKVGKSVLHGMLDAWLPRLVDGGAAFMVVHKHLGSDSLAKFLEDRHFTVARILSSKGYRVLRAKAQSSDDAARSEAMNSASAVGSVVDGPSADNA